MGDFIGADVFGDKLLGLGTEVDIMSGETDPVTNMEQFFLEGASGNVVVCSLCWLVEWLHRLED